MLVRLWCQLVNSSWLCVLWCALYLQPPLSSEDLRVRPGHLRCLQGKSKTKHEKHYKNIEKNPEIQSTVINLPKVWWTNGQVMASAVKTAPSCLMLPLAYDGLCIMIIHDSWSIMCLCSRPLPLSSLAHACADLIGKAVPIRDIWGMRWSFFLFESQQWLHVIGRYWQYILVLWTTRF